MILFFGPPGSGKSVQGQLLVERNNWRWLSTGELFRASKNPELLARLATGELIDDEITNQVLIEGLKQIDHDLTVVLDGYPRNTYQAEWLMDYLANEGSEIDLIIVFNVPEEELTRRLAGRGRDEDTLEVIKHRLDIYNDQTQPVLAFYESQQLPIFHVDGLGELDEIHSRIQQGVEARGLA